MIDTGAAEGRAPRLSEAVDRLTVGVIGAGTMGIGIGITVARAGHEVVIRDVAQQRVDTGLEYARRFLDQSVKRGKLTGEQRDRATTRLRGTTDLGALADCEIVVEVVPEELALKQQLLAELDRVCSAQTLYHTNTSTLSVSAIAAGSRHPERVVGTHYCNPAPLMELVELVPGRRTVAETVARTRAFLNGLGKRPVLCQDLPGFIVNRFLVPFENDCVRALEAGLGTVESIDRAVELGLGYPMGTFRLLDIVGLDIHRAVSISLYEQLRDPRFAPPPLVDRMISAGELGRKTGRGFYSYMEPGVMGT